MNLGELDRGPRLGARLANHSLDVDAAWARLVVIGERFGVEDRFDAARAKSQTDVDIFPTILGETLVETADIADRCERHRHVGRPKVVSAIVFDAPDGRRK